MDPDFLSKHKFNLEGSQLFQFLFSNKHSNAWLKKHVIHDKPGKYQVFYIQGHLIKHKNITTQYLKLHKKYFEN